MHGTTSPFHARSLPHIVARAAMALQNPVRASAHPRQLHGREWLILTALHDNAGASVNAIAGLCGQQQPTVSKALDRLAGMGLVECEIHDFDRRVKRVSLTESGRVLTAVLIEEWAGKQARLSEDPPAEIAPLLGHIGLGEAE